MVFRGQTIHENWDGQQMEQNAPNGIYGYRIRYCFEGFDEETTYQSPGFIQLLC